MFPRVVISVSLWDLARVLKTRLLSAQAPWWIRGLTRFWYPIFPKLWVTLQNCRKIGKLSFQLAEFQSEFRVLLAANRKTNKKVNIVNFKRKQSPEKRFSPCEAVISKWQLEGRNQAASALRMWAWERLQREPPLGPGRLQVREMGSWTHGTLDLEERGHRRLPLTLYKNLKPSQM